MKIKRVETKEELKHFYIICKEVYKYTNLHRSTTDDVVRLLIEGSSSFHTHASVTPFNILEDDRPVGRFALIHDQKLPNYIQVSFFEALPGLSGLVDSIKKQSQTLYPKCKQMVVGLDGHLNYGAGILLNRFDEPPVFGLPYTPAYYKEYFKELNARNMFSFRFRTKEFIEYGKKVNKIMKIKGIIVRTMNKRKLKRDAEIYTYLNNACFSKHPYWSERSVEEDFELFYPFRFLIREENLIFAEHNGKPIGFCLWYPDFNQLVKGDQHLGLRHVLRYRFANPINTFRFTEIAVLPEYRISPAGVAMMFNMFQSIEKLGYQYGEGGFIFEENTNSINMTRRFMERAFGEKIEPYRQYAVFDGEL